MLLASCGVHCLESRLNRVYYYLSKKSMFSKWLVCKILNSDKIFKKIVFILETKFETNWLAPEEKLVQNFSSVVIKFWQSNVFKQHKYITLILQLQLHEYYNLLNYRMCIKTGSIRNVKFNKLYYNNFNNSICL